MILVLSNKNKYIIIDVGYLKLIIFSFGMILYNISNFFVTYTNYKECSINFFLKHIGISTFLMTLYYMIELNHELGLKENIYNSKTEAYNEVNALDQLNVKIGNCNNTNKNICPAPIDIKYFYSLIQNEKQKKLINYVEGEINENILKKIKKINSMYFELLLLYFLNIVIMFFIIFSNYEDVNDISYNQNNNGYWIYKCSLEQYDLVFNINEFFLVLVIFIIGNQLSKYDNVFKYTKYISHSIIVILFGPLLNVK